MIGLHLELIWLERLIGTLYSGGVGSGVFLMKHDSIKIPSLVFFHLQSRQLYVLIIRSILIIRTLGFL